MSTLDIRSRNSVQVCLGYSEQGIKYKSALADGNTQFSALNIWNKESAHESRLWNQLQVFLDKGQAFHPLVKGQGQGISDKDKDYETSYKSS